MTKSVRIALAPIALSIGLALAGCSAQNSQTASPESATTSVSSSAAEQSNSSSAPATTASSTSSMAMDHSDRDMNHPADGGPAPEGIATAENPKFPVGSEVILTTDHMAGMDGAQATVVGAFKTTTYQVDYTPTTGGEKVTNHKWVVQEELKVPQDKKLSIGDKAVMTAEHMEGMNSAEATISGVTDQTVYMVDYTADGMTMKNHKWVVEDEMKAAK